MKHRVGRAGLRVAVVLLSFGLGVVHTAPASGQLTTVSKTAALQVDADNDIQISPGDTLRYTVTISGTANAIAFGDPIPDPNTALVVGTVTTSQGTVLSGNTAGDTQVGVNVGNLSNSSATITFDVTIDNPLPAGVEQVGDQGGVGCDVCGGGIPTDDPSTATANDATLTAVVAAPIIAATKTAALQVDADGDTNVSPGDTLRYTVMVTNSGNQDALAVFLDGIPDPNTALVVGSVATTFGTVASGNNAGETAVAVDLTNLAAAGGMATITFDATIVNPLPAGVTQVGDQGAIACSNCTTQQIPTDDPATMTPSDPTLTPVVSAPNVSATKAVTLPGSSTPALLVISGSVLQYTVVVTNSGNQDAAAVVFFDQPASGTTLLVGSVTTTLGVVVSGNNPGDTVVAVQIPTLGGGGGTATIMYQTQVDTLAAGTSVQLENQGSVTGANFSPTVTDNPNTPAANDPTVVVAIGPAPAPVLGSFGFAFAVILLVGVAAVRMRRASSDGRAE